VAEGVRGVAPNGVVSVNAGLYGEAVFLNKSVEIRAENGDVTISPPTLAPFDLVAVSVDDNGLPLNPKWGSQVGDQPYRPDPVICPAGRGIATDPGAPPCSNQFTYINSGICHEHVNWFGVTYEGQLRWEAHSCPLPRDDDDYTMNVTRDDEAAYPAYRSEIHVEFDSDETADHFDSPWWNTFKQAVTLDDNNPVWGCGTAGPLASAILNGDFAIITGLMNIDTYHLPRAPVEIHPVWAMAVYYPRIDYDVWAFFVRNWGDEGFCGSEQEFVYFPNNQYTFRVPWKPGALSILDITPIWHRYHHNYPDPTIRVVDGQAIFVTFQLDPPSGDGSMWDGEIRITWAH
jgi:hypothetical protein